MPGKDSKQKPKSNGRKPTPNGDKKTRDPNAKGPSVKKVKIIESIKLHFVQQYFRASDMVTQMENPEGQEPVPETYVMEVEDKPDEEAEAEVAEDKPEEEEPEKQEEDEQIEEREPE